MSILRTAEAKITQFLSNSRILPPQVRKYVRQSDAAGALPVDVYTTADEVVVLASVVGVLPRDIEINYMDNVLTIEGTFSPPVANVTYVLNERKAGRFSRKLAINVDIDAHKAMATIRDGLLTIVLPKATDSHSVVVRVPVEA